MSAKNINIVFVLDIVSGAVLSAIPVHAPQGQGITRKGGRHLLWVGSDDIGVLNAFDMDANFAPGYAWNFSQAPEVGEADDSLADPITGDLLVAAGDDAPDSVDPAQLATVDPATGLVTAFTLVPAHVEGFELIPGTDLVVVNTPDANSTIHVLDRKNSSIVQSCSLPAGFADQVPMAYDARRRHVMVGVHAPPALLVLDLGAGCAQVFSGPAPSGLDDMWYDEAAQLLFLSGGGTHLDGAVAVYSTPSGPGGGYTYLGQNTPAGKNSMVDMKTRMLYSIVPATSPSAPAFIQVYKY